MARDFGNKGGSKGARGGKPAAGRAGGRSGSRTENRAERPKRAAYASDRPRQDREDRAARPPARGARDERPARRSYGDDKPRRSYGEREERPRHSYDEDQPRRNYKARDDKPRRPGRDDRGGERQSTPRRYMRDEEGAPRKPRRAAPERKPFKGRFEDDAPEAAPRARKPRIGAETLSGGTSTPRVRIQANVWGQHAVRAAWLNPARTISALYTSPEELKLFQPVIEEARAAGIHRPEPTLVGREDLDKHLPRDAVHQGLAITAAEPEEAFIQDIINRGAGKERSIVVILDQVTDPHNVGAIIRSVCALGGDGVVMQRRHAPELTGVVAKAACGAIEHVLVAYETNLSRSIEALQAEGYTVAGLDERGENTVDSLRTVGKLALVLGAEGPGLRHLVKEHCDVLVKIRMDGPIPSLNVSNAAAVALYAAVG